MAILNPTDISLIFLGILIVMVLLEVRKLSRKPEPVSRLEEQFERLSRQMERIGAPQDIQLPGGAQIVEAGGTFETISEQLERLGESADQLDSAMLGEAGVQRFRVALNQLRQDVAAAQDLFEQTARRLGDASDTMLAAGSALQRVEARLEDVVGPKPEGGGQNGRDGRKPRQPEARRRESRQPEGQATEGLEVGGRKAQTE